MGRIQNKQDGFSAIETVLVLVIIVLVGVVGWLVYKNQHKPTTDSTTTKSIVSSSTTPSSTQPTDPTADWTSYVSATGGFSIKHPKNWVTSASSTNCPSGLLMLGSDSSSIGQCGTNNFGQMTISWQPARAQCGLSNTDWTINSTQNVTVSGVSGVKTDATSKVATTSGPSGTSTVQYCFITKGSMYTANYTEISSYPNSLSDFNIMITKTLIFN